MADLNEKLSASLRSYTVAEDENTQLKAQVEALKANADSGAKAQALQAELDQAKSDLASTRSQLADATKAADDMIRASPWRAVAAVALAGIAAGFLVSRRAPRADLDSTGRGRKILSELTGG